MNISLICKNQIETLHIKLYTNNNKKCYQMISMTNNNTENKISRNIIAPVDFFTIATAISCETSLDDFVAACDDTWASEAIAEMVTEIR